jgi:hypothetical protein
VPRCRTIVEWLPYVLLCAAHDGGRDSSVFEAGTLMRGSDTLEKFFASGMRMNERARAVQLRMGLARFVDNK